jgi:hypothetical protein
MTVACLVVGFLLGAFMGRGGLVEIDEPDIDFDTIKNLTKMETGEDYEILTLFTNKGRWVGLLVRSLGVNSKWIFLGNEDYPTILQED